MYLELLIYFLSLSVLGVIAWRILLTTRPFDQRLTKTRSTLFVLFIVYVSAVVSLTIIPSERFSLNNTIPLTNYIPVVNTYKRYVLVTWFENHHGIKNFWQNFIGNIVLFIPLGIFLALLFKKKLLGIMAIAFLSSFLIESLQFGSRYFGYYRHIDIDDVLLNTSGAVLGYALLPLYNQIHPRQNYLDCHRLYQLCGTSSFAAIFCRLWRLQILHSTPFWKDLFLMRHTQLHYPERCLDQSRNFNDG